jgi:hypothetical protein
MGLDMKITLSGGQIITIYLAGFDKFGRDQVVSVVQTFGEQVCRLPRQNEPIFSRRKAKKMG